MMQLITPDYYGGFVNDLAEMHRLRYRGFKERLEWDVQASGDMEVDEFDMLRPGARGRGLKPRRGCPLEPGVARLRHHG